MKKARVAIVGTVGVPAKYGGFETLAEYLVQYLSNKVELTVYCSSKAYKDRPKEYNGAKLKYIPFNANGISSLIYDAISILHAVWIADVILMLGVSGAFLIPFVKLFTNKKVIVNIDGLEWKRDKWGKTTRKLLKALESISVRFADEVISDNQGIQEYVFEEYDKVSNLIAYGASHCASQQLSTELLAELNLPQEDYAFSVCRIEPENNTHVILEAFAQTDYPVFFVGNWENSEYGKGLRKKFGNKKNLFLLDPIYDQGKLNQLRSNCSMYIHGHSAGGTNPSLVEAMWLNLPVIAWDVNYNRFTTQKKAFYFQDADSLAKIVEELRVSSAELKNKGEEMGKIARKYYNWQTISNQYYSLMVGIDKVETVSIPMKEAMPTKVEKVSSF